MKRRACTIREGRTPAPWCETISAAKSDLVKIVAAVITERVCKRARREGLSARKREMVAGVASERKKWAHKVYPKWTPGISDAPRGSSRGYLNFNVKRCTCDSVKHPEEVVGRGFREYLQSSSACVRACVHACVRVCVRACMRDVSQQHARGRRMPSTEMQALVFTTADRTSMTSSSAGSMGSFRGRLRPSVTKESSGPTSCCRRVVRGGVTGIYRHEHRQQCKPV